MNFHQYITKKSIAIYVVAFLCSLISFKCMAHVDNKVQFNSINKVLNLFSVWTDKVPNKALLNEVAGYIDYAEMAERAIGGSWYSLSPLDKKEFAYVIRHYIEDKYYRRWNKILSKGKLVNIKQVDTKDSIYVKTKLELRGDDDEIIVWRLSKRTKDLKIISIAVDNKDLLSRLNRRIAKHIRKKGFKTLLVWMKDKADLEEVERPKNASK